MSSPSSPSRPSSSSAPVAARLVCEDLDGVPVLHLERLGRVRLLHALPVKDEADGALEELKFK